MKSLSEIYSEVKKVPFRVRNVETNEDWFIVMVTLAQNRPVIMSAIRLEGCSFTKYQYSASHKVYALLSSKEECVFWQGLSHQQATFRAKSFYRRAS
jgi:hypothetical protein